MRFGLPPRGLSLRGLGQISDEELAHVNARLTELNERLTHQFSIIYAAQRGGFGRDIVDEAMQSYDRILQHLRALASTPPSNPAALEEWLARAEGVDAQIGELESHTQSSLGAGETGRMLKITLATMAVLGGAAAIGIGVWYYSRSRRWYRHVYGRRRR